MKKFKEAWRIEMKINIISKILHCKDQRLKNIGVISEIWKCQNRVAIQYFSSKITKFLVVRALMQ